MNNYIIYSLDTGIIKSIITTAGNPKNDVHDGYDYIKSNDLTEGMSVDLQTKKLISADIQLPFVLSDQGKRKKKRNAFLAQSDWTQLPDSPLTEKQKAEWATYRQALRDIPATYSDADSLDDIIFPVQPEV
jgi:hypothetical protein